MGDLPCISSEQGERKCTACCKTCSNAMLFSHLRARGHPLLCWSRREMALLWKYTYNTSASRSMIGEQYTCRYSDSFPKT